MLAHSLQELQVAYDTLIGKELAMEKMHVKKQFDGGFFAVLKI